MLYRYFLKASIILSLRDFVGFVKHKRLLCCILYCFPRHD